MSYALSFAPEFFWGKVPVEKMKPSDRPTSVYQAILSLTDQQWASLARELFGIEPNNLDVEMVIERVIKTLAAILIRPSRSGCRSPNGSADTRVAECW